MFCLFSSSKGFPYSSIPAIYAQSLQEAGAFQYPEKPEVQRDLLAEEDFLSYIRQDFFPRAGSLYALWQENGQYVSALRGEPYRDGILLSGLETLPNMRGQGYAGMLLKTFLEYLQKAGISRVYSHVSKKNAPSLAVHKSCGFAVYKDSAVYLDGSADSRSYTLLKIFKENENNA